MSQPFPQSQPPPVPMGQLVLTLRKPFGLGSASVISPKATIDGYPAAVRWGQTAYPVTPGEHRLRLSASYLWEYGAADQSVTIQPGQSVEVHYSPPVVTFGVPGRIGFAPQPIPGMAVFWAIMAVPVVIAMIVVFSVVTS